MCGKLQKNLGSGQESRRPKTLCHKLCSCLQKGRMFLADCSRLTLAGKGMGWVGGFLSLARDRILDKDLGHPGRAAALQPVSVTVVDIHKHW